MGGVLIIQIGEIEVYIVSSLIKSGRDLLMHQEKPVYVIPIYYIVVKKI
jgi:hypothetical protein